MGSVSGGYLLEHVQKTVVFTIECDALPQTQLSMGVGCITGYAWNASRYN